MFPQQVVFIFLHPAGIAGSLYMYMTNRHPIVGSGRLDAALLGNPPLS